MTPDLLTAAIRTLTTVAKPEDVREQARALGVTQRQGKMDSYALLMVVVLGLVTRGHTTIAQLGQVYARVTGVRFARSSFWARFNPPFFDLVQWLLDRLVVEAHRPTNRPPGILHCFTDVFAEDSSVLKVHDSLRGIWKGTRRNTAKAALKLHARIRVFTGQLVKYKITAEAYGDSRALGADQGLRGALLLLDRGYASPSLWRRVEGVGGYFLTRVPRRWNQVIASENRNHRGRARSLVGKNLLGALDGLKRAVVDVNVTFRCRVRAYSGGRARFVKHDFRVVALKRPDGKYAVYATNVPPQMLPAEEMWNVYRLRWEVETFFKTAKSGCALSDTPTRDKHRVLALVYAALIRATVAMSAKARFIRLVPARNRVRINPGQWIRWWNRQLFGLLDGMGLGDGPLGLDDLCLMLADPNRRRLPSRNAFVDQQ